MDRRTFLALPAAALIAKKGTGRFFQSDTREKPSRPLFLADIERERVLRAANRYLGEKPITITATSSPRSAGGRHDFFSEGDYWWPDPANPDGPYIRRDGETNPDNFVGHRHAMVRLSLQVPALAAAWKLTGERRYADHALRHLRAWFIDPETVMNPHLLYAQAIKGHFTGRGIGIIDTLHLVEVARAASVLDGLDATSSTVRADVREWFSRYLTWMTTHQYGIDERNAENNHGTCWVAQAGEFARYTEQRRVDGLLPATVQDGPGAGTNRAGRQLPAGDRSNQALRLFAIQSRRVCDRLSVAIGAGGQPVAIRAGRRPGYAEGDGIHVSVYRR